ncbi:hypothetical protein [Vibrio crassostreae]|uniref:hypothetical protein n=1 Tax=Vibrio crassostreae TaxID=246167 RepID=UPI001B30D5DF|nr:hypothetical protein [Vibrio crassostreae]
MSRIAFTANSANDLKTTLSNAIKVMNRIFWYEVAIPFYDDEFFGLGDDGRHFTLEDVEKIIPVKPFKPQRNKFYNRFAKVVGYNDWTELTSASELHQDGDLETIYVHQHEDLQAAIMGMFEATFLEQFPMSESEAFYNPFLGAVKQASGLVTDAIILNPNTNVDAGGFIKEFGEYNPDVYVPNKLAHIGYDSDQKYVCHVSHYELLLPVVVAVAEELNTRELADAYNNSDPRFLLDEAGDVEDIFVLNDKLKTYSTEPEHALAGAINLLCWICWTGRERASNYNNIREVHLEAETKAQVVEDVMSPWNRSQ